MNYIFSISKATILRFLNKEELGWKEPIIRVKMKCFKTLRLTVWKKKRLEQCYIYKLIRLYLHNSGISMLTSKGENSIVVKEKHSNK